MKKRSIKKRKGFMRLSLIREEGLIAVLLWAIIAAGLLTWKNVAPALMNLKPFEASIAATDTPCDIPFSVEETLMFPTLDGASLTMMPKDSTNIFIEYGVESGIYTKKTAPQSVAAGQAAKFTLNGLRPDKKIYYRVRCTNPGEKRFSSRPEHTFNTLRSPGKTFTFVYGTDSHYYELWSGQTFSGGNGAPLQSFNLSLAHITNDHPDFHVIGGDWAMTECKCPGGMYNGESYASNDTVDASQALKRYVKTFAPDAYGQVTKDIPITYILGNHDGEAGFDVPVLNASYSARSTLFPELPASYHGDPEGRYYAFESGSARFIFVDVMRNTVVVPQTADDWKLGQTQLDWLHGQLTEAAAKGPDGKLRNPLVFIIAEHLDGGEPSYGVLANNTWYGRGGLKATVDDLTSGMFKGEQAKIQDMEMEYTAAGGTVVFMSGHDHIAITPTEKPNLDGTGTHTYMLKGGRMGGVGFGWVVDNAFKKEMDWDGNGNADYLDIGLGTKTPGYFRITVNGTQGATFEYILSDKDNPALDNTVAFSKTISTQ